MKLRSLTYLYLFSKTRARSIIEKDIERWTELYQIPAQGQLFHEEALRYLMFHWPEFRNLFYFRTAKDGGRLTNLFRKLTKSFYHPLQMLLIESPDVGPGFFIQHGYSTIVYARHVGRNCWVNQQVTIGFSGKNKFPTIGNNVRISAGAKVLGQVTVGDNVIIGANAVVVKDVPSNCTVVGVPAYIVRRNGERVHEELSK